MGQGTESIDHLINLELLDALFDEWMHTDFHTISAVGTKVIVIDKDGTRTETDDLAAAAKDAKSEWDNTYKPAVISATDNADSKAALANEKAGLANTAAQGASNVNAILGSTGGIVTLTVTDRAGNTVTKEVGFRFAKIYASYEAMQADFSGTDVQQGQFVLISSNVEDPHNAEFYVKNASAWGLMGDLSGAQGIKGDTPVLTATADGVIYSDGTLLTDILKVTNDTAIRNEQTRQQTFTTNEAQRQTDFDTAQSSRNITWTDWFSDSLATGVRKLWNDFWSSVNTSWNGFFGTSAEDANGVRKIWSDWFSGAQQDYADAEGTGSSVAGDGSRWGAYKTAENARDDARLAQEGTSASTAGDGTRWGAYKTAEASRENGFDSSQLARNTAWTEWFSDTLATGVRKIWNDWFAATRNAWTAWFGNDDTSGVQKDWKDTKADATEATGRANTAAGLCEAWNTHPPYIGDGTMGDLNYWYLYNINTETYVKGPYAKGDNLDWSSITQEEKDLLIAEMLQTLEAEGFDAVPTPNSTKPVRSGGIYNALAGKQDTLTFASDDLCEQAADEIMFVV